MVAAGVPGIVSPRWVAEYTDHFDRAERLAMTGLAPGKPRRFSELGRITLARLYVGQGRWEDARAQFDSVAEGDPELAARERAVLASLPFLAVAPDDLRRSLSAVLARTPDRPDETTPAELGYEAHKRHYLAGLLNSKLGDARAALAHADSIEALPDPAVTAVPEGLGATIRADVAWRQGRPPDEVLAALEPVYGQVPAGAWRDPLLGQEHARFIRARALIDAVRVEEALRWLEHSFVLTPGWHYYKAPVRYLSARAHEARSRPDDARIAREGFARLWRDPDAAVLAGLESGPVPITP